MNITYHRDREHNYMVLEAPESFDEKDYQMRMILENELPNLLACEVRRLDGILYLYYEITSKQPVKRIFHHHRIGYADLHALLMGMERSLGGVTRYLLDENSLLLDWDLIYMDIETREVSFCYLPCWKGDIEETFREFTEELLKILDHEDEKAVLLGYRIYSGTVKENYSVSGVLHLLYQGIEETAKQREVPKRRNENLTQEKMDESWENKSYVQIEQPRKVRIRKEENSSKTGNHKIVWIAVIGLIGVMIIIALTVGSLLNLTQAGGLLFLMFGVLLYLETEKREQKKEKRVKREEKESEIWKEEETEEAEEEFCEYHEEQEEPMEELEIYGQTTFLGRRTEGQIPMLVSSQPEVRGNITIDKERIVIGKLKGQVDVVLNMPMISRMHASIEKRQGIFFLTDLNSTNGTMLNGQRLDANEFRQLCSGDEISFAGAVYYFQE